MNTKLHCIFITLALLAGIHQADAQGTTAFTYQGQLHDGGTNANGTYIMGFKLYDAVTNGNQISTSILTTNSLANGLFTVNLDFGASAFNGSNRWLDVAITNSGTGQTLSPRVQVLPTPYALSASRLNTTNWNISEGNIVSGFYTGDGLGVFNNGALVFGIGPSGAVLNGYLHAYGFNIDQGLQFGNNSSSSINGITGGVGVNGLLTVNGVVNGTAFNTTSDRNLKEKFAPVNSSKVLELVANLPISSWNFKTDGQTRHIGPMAQDFYAAFNVGTDDKHIATVDEDGVALAAIQGLNEKLKDKNAEFQKLKTQNELLEKRLSDLEQWVKTSAHK